MLIVTLLTFDALYIELAILSSLWTRIRTYTKD